MKAAAILFATLPLSAAIIAPLDQPNIFAELPAGYQYFSQIPTSSLLMQSPQWDYAAYQVPYLQGGNVDLTCYVSPINPLVPHDVCTTPDVGPSPFPLIPVAHSVAPGVPTVPVIPTIPPVEPTTVPEVSAGWLVSVGLMLLLAAWRRNA